MDIQFVAQIDASADVVAFPVRKGEAGALGALLGAAAAQARFDGAAGAIAETAAIDGEAGTAASSSSASAKAASRISNAAAPR
jgi:hypothetical protein